MLRTFPLLIVMLFCFFVSAELRAEGDPPPAVEAECQRFYSSLDWRIKYQSPWMTARKKLEPHFPWNLFRMGLPKENIAKLESLKARDIFTKPATRNHNGVLEISTTNEDLLKFESVFQDLMNNRVRAGVLPSEIKKDFIVWLGQVDNQSYPKINHADFYERFAKSNRPVYEYFDERLLEYFKARHGVGQPSVPQAINGLERTVSGRALTRFHQRRKRVGKYLLYTAGTGVSTAFSLQLYEKIIRSGTDPVLQLVEKPITNSVKSGVESIVDGARVALKWPEKSDELLTKLQAVNAEFKNEDYTELKNPEAEKKMNERQAAISAVLPEFREVLLAKDKDFETNWTKILTENKPGLAAALSTFSSNRRELIRSRSIINRNGGPGASANKALEEDNALIEAEQKRTEAQIVGMLTTYHVYKTIRGEKNPMEKALERDYLLAAEKYMLEMKPEPLRKAVAEGVDVVIQKIAEWHKGEGGNKVPDAGSAVPVKSH